VFSWLSCFFVEPILAPSVLQLYSGPSPLKYQLALGPIPLSIQRQHTVALTAHPFLFMTKRQVYRWKQCRFDGLKLIKKNIIIIITVYYWHYFIPHYLLYLSLVCIIQMYRSMKHSVNKSTCLTVCLPSSVTCAHWEAHVYSYFDNK